MTKRKEVKNSIKYDVVVLPFVPVTPIKQISLDGLPQNSAA